MMTRTVKSFDLKAYPEFKKQLLQWVQQYREVVCLDSNNHSNSYSNWDMLVAVDAFTALQTDSQAAFADLQEYQTQTQDWLFGYLSYDLKNDTEALHSHNFDGLEFPDLFFFQPQKLFLFKGQRVEFHYLKVCDDELESDFKLIAQTVWSADCPQPKLDILERISRETYLQKAEKFLEHIQRGDIYEANFCMEFYAEQAQIDPVQVYQKLNAISTAPFAAFFKNKDHYALCASPERYLQKNKQQIISQPIKGTAKRQLDPALDAQAMAQLKSDPKERSENIMIVDLVRNDLSRTAAKGAVEVLELCEIYTFQQVHQMISTVTSQIEATTSAVEVLRTTFPMGSMTGAPKISALQIIENLEETKRGLYSGALGYFSPQGDFDFNVVIRSILYNSKLQYLSFSVGSAFTSLAVPEREYEECLLKAQAMRRVLQGAF